MSVGRLLGRARAIAKRPSGSSVEAAAKADARMTSWEVRAELAALYMADTGKTLDPERDLGSEAVTAWLAQLERRVEGEGLPAERAGRTP